MKVLMINPNRYWPYVAPVGLEYVCNSLAQASIPFEVADLNFISQGALLRKLKHETFGVIGITLRNIDSTTLILNEFFLPKIKKLIHKIKSIRPCAVVVGGSGFSHLPKEILDYVGADFGVVGFGEKALVELIRALEQHRSFESINNLVWRDRGVIRLNPFSNQGYAEVPARQRRFVQNTEYYSVYKMIGIETRRGCHRACGFCYEPEFAGHRVSGRPLDKIIEEIKDLKHQGMDSLIFCDSEFNLGDREFIQELCQRLIAESLEVTWTTSFYPEGGFPPELFQLMHAAGCRELALSVDSGADALLKSMGKTYTAADVAENSKNIRAAGIRVMHYYLIGWPGESFASIDATLDLIRTTRPDMSIFFVGIRIAPCTPLAKIAEAQGMITPQTNLLNPVFYNPRQVLREFYPYLRQRAKSIPQCVLPTRWRNLQHSLIHQAVRSGFPGVISDLGGYIRSLPPTRRLQLVFSAFLDFALPGRSILRKKKP